MKMASLQSFTDEQLVQAFQSSGDNLYIREIYQRHRQKVFYTCLGIVKDREIANDLVQDIILKMMQHLPQLKNGKLLGLWLHRIANNHCIDHQKSLSNWSVIEADESLEIEDTSVDMDNLQFKEALIDSLNNIIQLLSYEDQILIKLKYFDRYSIGDLEKYFGLSKSAIKMRLARARERMRKSYQKCMETTAYAQCL